MTSNDLAQSLKQKVLNKAEEILQRKAEMLKMLLKYEIAIANTELAMSSKDHGYNFKFIPDAYADGVVIGEKTTTDNKIHLSVSIPQYVFKNASEDEIEFFKTFILSNALIKLKRES